MWCDVSNVTGRKAAELISGKFVKPIKLEFEKVRLGVGLCGAVTLDAHVLIATTCVHIYHAYSCRCTSRIC